MRGTVYAAFIETAARLPDRPALMHKVGGQYQTITFRKLSRLVDLTAAGLARRGVKPGSRVGIYSYNRPEWVVADLALIKLGAVVVPVYHTLPEDSIRYILRDAEVTHLFVENAELLATATKVLADLPLLRDVVLFFAQAKETRTGKELFSLAALQESGAQALNEDPTLAKPHENRPDDLLTICYTSGTTGEPKGAMLTHSNIMSNVAAAIERFNISERDLLLSFLPLCHMFERTCGYYTMLLAGATIAYAESLQTITEDIRLVRPTLLIVVPRVLEKVYSAVTERILTGPALNRFLMRATLRATSRCARYRARHETPPLWLRIWRWALDRIVVSKLRKLGGGRIRLIVSGSAPLEKRIARTFRNLGFNLIEGYGLTETSPVVCTLVPGEEKIGSVGKPFPGIEISIGPDSEVLVRGPNVMKGYLNKPEETARTIDAACWLHTGDQGRLDPDGNLIITGRLKEIIVTSYGKNIAPVPIEQALCASRFFEQAVVIGDRRPFLTALIVPGRVALEDHARTAGIPFSDFPALLTDPRIVAIAGAEVARQLSNFAAYEQVKKFRLIAEPMTIENGLLTPTLKVRRQKAAERYRQEIEAMYQEQ